MTRHQPDPNTHNTAQRVCTPKELEALHLYEKGMSERTIALALGISRGAVRERIHNATRKIADAQRKGAA